MNSVGTLHTPFLTIFPNQTGVTLKLQVYHMTDLVCVRYTCTFITDHASCILFG